MPQSASSFRFLDLPQEIKNCIYELYIGYRLTRQLLSVKAPVQSHSLMIHDSYLDRTNALLYVCHKTMNDMLQLRRYLKLHIQWRGHRNYAALRVLCDGTQYERLNNNLVELHLGQIGSGPSPTCRIQKTGLEDFFIHLRRTPEALPRLQRLTLQTYRPFSMFTDETCTIPSDVWKEVSDIAAFKRGECDSSWLWKHTSELRTNIRMIDASKLLGARKNTIQIELTVVIPFVFSRDWWSPTFV